MFSLDLASFIEFLSIARSAARWLGPDGTGIAVIHNYVWDYNGTITALRVGPRDHSAFLPPDAIDDTIAVFAPVADEMLRIGEQVGGAETTVAAKSDLDLLI